MDTYQSKIDATIALIEEHNKTAPTKIDSSKFIECLKNSGATTDVLLNDVMFEDLQACGLPIILARSIVNRIFRAKTAPTEAKDDNASKYISEKRAAAMTIKELVERYDPAEADNHVGKRLKEMTKSQPCIAFDDDGKVLVDASAKEAKRVREELNPRISIIVGGIPRRVYVIGERPNTFIAENPLYPGRPLFDDECDQTGRSWSGIPEVVRGLLRVAIADTRDVSITQLKDAHDMLDLAVRSDAEKAIRNRYQRTSVRYDELKLEGKLPTLKINRNQYIRKNNPFGSNHTF